MIRNIFLSLILVFLVATGGRTQSAYNNLLTIPEFNKEAMVYGTYHVEGFVIGVYESPACPKGALCKPTLPSHIIVSVLADTAPDLPLGEYELIIVVENPKEFKIGKKYRFLVQVLDAKNFNQLSNNTKLVYSERIK